MLAIEESERILKYLFEKAVCCKRSKHKEIRLSLTRGHSKAETWEIFMAHI